jgi:RNA polymerase sigma factor (sigma-70 family)
MKNSNSTSENNSDKKVLSIVPLLHPYVKQRIRVGENLGIFPKNMFRSNEIIDDVILKVYEKGILDNIELNDLRIVMFDIAYNKLMSLFENEKWHKKTISTKFILEEELKQLEENFTVDAGNELIMNEELEDISYHQNDHGQLPYDNAQKNVLSFLDISDTRLLEDRKKKNTLNKVYFKLPLQTSNVVDLYILGKLSLQEIATILQIKIIEIKRIVDYVKDKFQKHLN